MRQTAGDAGCWKRNAEATPKDGCKMTDAKRRVPSAAVSICLAVIAIGCQSRTETVEPARKPITQAADTRPEAKSVAPSVDREVWDVVYIDDTKVGYAHTRYARGEEGGEPVVTVSSDQQLTVTRFGQATTIQTRYVSWETPDGRVLRFSSEMDNGAAIMTTKGEYRGGQMWIKSTTTGNATPTPIPWDPSWGGFFATEQRLEAKPMTPGERRTFKTLAPLLNQVGQVELEAADYETTKLLSDERELLRINGTLHLGPTTLKTVAWTDRSGETLKTLVSIGDAKQLTYRATRDLALQDKDPGSFDLGLDTIVRVERDLPQPHQTTRMVYRARLDGGDPSKRFASGGSQQVRAIDDQTAEITVRAVRPDTDLGDSPVAERPDESMLARTNYLQTDDERVVAMALSVAPQETDPWTLACQLERCVHDRIRSKNFSQALATAADVARDLEGDCTEHAVLLAALCRVREIPSRVAIGLVYFSPVHGFAYHMWTEVWCADRWIPLDATLGQGGIGAAHLKIRHSNLEGVDSLGAFLPVLDLMGKLRLEIVAVTSRAVKPEIDK